MADNGIIDICFIDKWDFSKDHEQIEKSATVVTSIVQKRNYRRLLISTI